MDAYVVEKLGESKSPCCFAMRSIDINRYLICKYCNLSTILLKYVFFFQTSGNIFFCRFAIQQTLELYLVYFMVFLFVFFLTGMFKVPITWFIQK